MVEPEQLKRLLDAAADAERLVILPHNDPDPDAIASAGGLRHLLTHSLGRSVSVAYKGIVGRSENQALTRYLGRPMHRLRSADLSAAIALVDTQPGAGNNALPPSKPPAIVLDHHPTRSESAAAVFADVRPNLGATSTLVLGYLQAAGIEPPTQLATALFYGIKTDTMGLGRGAVPQDVTAYFYLQTRIDVKALAEIEQAQVPAVYFQSLDMALHAARVYAGLVVCYLGPMHRPDLAAEIADILLRLQGTHWVVCLGVFKSHVILSVRSSRFCGGAGELAQAIVGSQSLAGGHGTMAGGRVPLKRQPPDQVAAQLVRRALAYLQIPTDAPGEPLI